jgi:hypothetical protein
VGYEGAPALARDPGGIPGAPGGRRLWWMDHDLGRAAGGGATGGWGGRVRRRVSDFADRRH